MARQGTNHLGNVGLSTNESPARPFLRWAGSKRQLLPILAQFWNDDYRRYVEPFAGSAALFFHLSPPEALLGDINAELILTYHQVKHNLPGVVRGLETMQKNRRSYLKWRAARPKNLKAPIRAARFVFLNRYCFNGLYRTNAAGQFNVPYGGRKAGAMPSFEVFKRCSSALQNAELVAGGFQETLKRVTHGDFVYMDPPFRIRSRRVFNEYDAASFDHKSLLKLRKMLLTLDKMGIPFLVSYANSEEAHFLAEGFSTMSVEVRRCIAGFSSSREKVLEALIFNRNPSSISL